MCRVGRARVLDADGNAGEKGQENKDPHGNRMTYVSFFTPFHAMGPCGRKPRAVHPRNGRSPGKRLTWPMVANACENTPVWHVLRTTRGDEIRALVLATGGAPESVRPHLWTRLARVELVEDEIRLLDVVPGDIAEKDRDAVGRDVPRTCPNLVREIVLARARQLAGLDQLTLAHHLLCRSCLPL